MFCGNYAPKFMFPFFYFFPGDLRFTMLQCGGYTKWVLNFFFVSGNEKYSSTDQTNRHDEQKILKKLPQNQKSK